MSEAESLIDKAVDELYALDLDQFTPRRTELAKAARTAGDKDAAKAITALRKPTQSAFTINRLARTDPATIDSLVEVGAEMRTAQRSADGKQLRELNTQRRKLLDNLTRRAFEIIGQQSPSAGQREEVNATLMAALADASVAEQLQQGILVRAAESSGFGFSPPELTVIRSTSKRPETEPTAAAPARVSRAVGKTPAAAADSERDSAALAREREKTAEAERRAAAEERRQQTHAREVARAQDEADAADDAVHAAVAAIDASQQLIRMLQRQLTDARRELEEHQKEAKTAENRQRKAREALNKAKG